MSSNGVTLYNEIGKSDCYERVLIALHRLNCKCLSSYWTGRAIGKKREKSLLSDAEVKQTSITQRHTVPDASRHPAALVNTNGLGRRIAFSPVNASGTLASNVLGSSRRISYIVFKAYCRP